MPTFSTDKERKKWASLQHSAGTSLSAIVQGRGTSSDFQRVMNILNQQGGLAAQVFAQAVSTAEVQARKFEAAYQQVLNSRQDETLTAFELALNDQLSKLAPDLIKSIQEIIELSVVQSNEDLTRTIGSKFSDLHWLLPKRDLPTVDDLLAAQDLLAERIEETDEARWKIREPALIEKIAQVFESTLRSLADRINRERASQQGAQPGHNPQAPIPRLPAPTQVPTVLQRAMPLLGGGPSRSSSDIAVQSSSTAVVGVTPRTQQSLTTAAQTQTSLYQKLKDLLPALPSLGRNNKQQDNEDEQDKADTWWRSFKNWFGDRKDQFKKFSRENSGWLKALGGTLALMVLNPQLFQTLGEAIKKYLTWDNLVDAVSTAWDWISKQATGVLDWVMETLGLKKNLQNVKKAIEQNSPVAPVINAVKDVQSGKKSTTQAVFDALVTPDERKGLSDFILGHGSRSDMLKNFAFGKASKDNGLRNLFFHDGGSNTAIDSASMANIVNRTSITSSSIASGPTATYSVDASNLSMRPGVTTLPPGATPQTAAGTGDGTPAKGAPQMGISSYNFNAANSDSLTMMNTYHFTSG